MPEIQVPAWPRGLSEELAAAYIGLSVSSLRSEVRAGRAPQPVRITPKRLIYLRDKLDAYLDRIAGIAPPSASGATDAASEWDAFLNGPGHSAIS